MTEVAPHLTPLEIAWTNVPPGHRVGLRRSDIYDFGMGLYHSPGVYEYRPIQPNIVTATTGMVIDRLENLVHPGITDVDMPTRCPSSHFGDQRSTISEAVFHQLLRNSESTLIFGGAIDELLAAFRDDRAMQILSLLSHTLIGNRRNKDYLSHKALADLVSTCLRERLPFQLVLPAFPFKDQNPFRTASPASHWDIGEVSLLIRLHCIALGLNQLHPFDGECLIVSDGRAYAQIFGVRDSEAMEYLEGLRGIRNGLNMNRTVHLVDLRSIMEKADRSFVMEWGGAKIVGLRSIIGHIESQLELVARSEESVSKELDTLAESMVWNMETRDYVSRVATATLWRAMNPRCIRLDAAASELRAELRARSWRVGLKYAAFSISLGLTGFWEVMFPTSIRATVHAKAGQAVIPKLGRGDPWNAVGIIDDSGLGPDAVKTLPLWKVARDLYRPVYLAGSASRVAMVRRGVQAGLSSQAV